jgi:hypothetical protein
MYLSIPSLSLESICVCVCRYIMSWSLNIITFLCCPISYSWSSKLQKFINCNFLSVYTVDDLSCFLVHDCVVKCVGGHVDRNMLPTCSDNGGSMFVSTWVLVTGSRVFYLAAYHSMIINSFNFSLLPHYIRWMAGWILGYFTKYQPQWLFPVK